MKNDIYTKKGIMYYLDNDELDAEEQGFMFGYLEA